MEGGFFDRLRMWWKRHGAWLLLVLLPALTYADTLRAGWLWDDSTLIYGNPLLKQPGGLWKLWFSTAPTDYLPILNSLFWIEYHAFGTHAGAYHAVHLALHLTAVLLVWRLLAALELSGAWLGALIFAVHPVGAASVCWISEQKNTLSLVFYALSAWLFFRAEGDLKWGQTPILSELVSVPILCALAAFVAALASKSSGVALPLVFLVLLAFRRARIGVRDLVRVAPFLAAAGVFSAITIWFQVNRAIGNLVLHPAGEGPLTRVAASAWAVWFYLGKDVLPWHLAAVYSRWTVDPDRPSSWVPMLALVGSAVLLWRARKARWARAGLAALAAYVLLLLPVLGFVDMAYLRYSLVADHWQFLALVAFAAAAGAALARAPRVLVAAVLAALCFLTWQRTQVYADSTHLWEDTVRKSPGAWVAHHMLGSAYLASDRLHAAEIEERRAIQLYPEHSLAWYNLGLVRMRLGHYGDAIRYYERALRLQPTYAAAANNLAWVFATCPQARFRDVLEAMQWARRACALSAYGDPQYLDTLAAACANDGRYQEAVGLVERALRLVAPSDGAMRAQLEQRLRLYQENRPYREPRPPPDARPSGRHRAGGWRPGWSRMPDVGAQVRAGHPRHGRPERARAVGVWRAFSIRCPSSSTPQTSCGPFSPVTTGPEPDSVVSITIPEPIRASGC